MNKKIKLTKLLNVLANDNTKADFEQFDKHIDLLKTQLREKIQFRTIDDVQNLFDKFQRKISVQPLTDAINNIRDAREAQWVALNSDLEDKTNELHDLVNLNDSLSKERASNLKIEIDDLQKQISTFEIVRKQDLKMVDKCKSMITQCSNMISDMENRMGEMATQLSSRVDVLENAEPPEIKDWQETIDKLRFELFNQIANMGGGTGGGNMNRNIAVGSNSSVLSKYTDINIKAGNNVTLTYTNNDTTKFLDLTIAATGGSGVTRTIESTAVSSTVGAVSSTDYVVLCTQGVKITLPTAVSNTNLYTIKNVSNSSIMVIGTGGETIDNDANIIMPVKYTAVDLISDNSNWNIT